MPSVTSTTGEENNEMAQNMRNALKRHIIRERQRKREEYEAEVEEERLRKEREARERQDVMTLEETKEQIEQLEQKLKTLEKEKQQLFMQLKKVLNEDQENRKRQQQKESSEMPPMKMPMGNIQIPMFLPPTSQGQGEPPPNQGRPPPLTSHILNKPNMPVQGGLKRGRSPSPTYALYQRMHQPQLKHQAVYSDHKLEDGRTMGRQMARAVLWNKPTQYTGTQVGGASVSTAGYYSHLPTSGGVVGVVGERPPPLLYAAHHGHTPHHANIMYAPQPQQQLYLDILKRDQDNKKEQPQVLIGLSDAHHPGGGFAPQTQPPVSRQLTIHPSQPMHNNMQPNDVWAATEKISHPPKPGSITQGYPVRQAQPNVQNPNIYQRRY